MLETLGFEHVMYSVKVLDDDGFFSGITLKRKTGRSNFTPLEQRIVHIVIGIVSGVLGVPDPALTCRTYGRMIGRTYSTIPDLQSH